ncbi:MAG: hypothetical protein ACR2F6_05750 [Mycobacteriales bacterium]
MSEPKKTATLHRGHVRRYRANLDEVLAEQHQALSKDDLPAAATSALSDELFDLRTTQLVYRQAACRHPRPSRPTAPTGCKPFQTCSRAMRAGAGSHPRMALTRNPFSADLS